MPPIEVQSRTEFHAPLPDNYGHGLLATLPDEDDPRLRVITYDNDEAMVLADGKGANLGDAVNEWKMQGSLKLILDTREESDACAADILADPRNQGVIDLSTNLIVGTRLVIPKNVRSVCYYGWEGYGDDKATVQVKETAQALYVERKQDEEKNQRIEGFKLGVVAVVAVAALGIALSRIHKHLKKLSEQNRFSPLSLGVTAPPAPEVESPVTASTYKVYDQFKDAKDFQSFIMDLVHIEGRDHVIHDVISGKVFVQVGSNKANLHQVAQVNPEYIRELDDLIPTDGNTPTRIIAP